MLTRHCSRRDQLCPMHNYVRLDGQFRLYLDNRCVRELLHLVYPAGHRSVAFRLALRSVCLRPGALKFSVEENF